MDFSEGEGGVPRVDRVRQIIITGERVLKMNANGSEHQARGEQNYSCSQASAMQGGYYEPNRESQHRHIHKSRS